MDSIINYLEHWAAVQPDTRFSTFLDLSGNTRETYTYLDFHERTQYLAENLSTREGLKHGDRVLLVYPAGLEGIVAFFACARIGVIPVPVPAPTAMSSASAFAKLGFVARDCRAAAVLTSTGTHRTFQLLLGQSPNQTLGEHTTGLRKLDWIATDNVRGEVSGEFRNDPHPILFLQYTSGSTSDPKGVIVSHENVVHNARATIDHIPIGVSWLPQYHDMGLVGYYLFPVVMGGTNYGLSPMDFLKRPLLWLQTISRFRATYASSPNFGFEYCLREDKVPSDQLEGLDLSSLRVLMNAAEPVRAQTQSRFLKRFAPYGLREQAHVVAYGLAENTLAVTHYGGRFCTLNKKLLQQGTVCFQDPSVVNNDHFRLISCGRPLDGVHVRIVNPETCAALGERQIGEIWLAGRSTCKGYWNRPGLTARVFRNTIGNDPADSNAYLRTGDLGFLCEGELFVCGRIKDLIIIRGVNYYPQEIEMIVESASPKIRPGGVAAFNGDDEKDTLVVLAEVKSVKDLPDPADIALAIRTQYAIEPHTIAWVSSGTIAKTTSGKTARRLTRLRWFNRELCAVAIHTFREQACATVASGLRERFRAVLEQYHLAGHEEDTFAEIGVDSLTLILLIDMIEQLLEEHGATYITNELDPRIIQRLTVAEFFSLLDQFGVASDERIVQMQAVLRRVKREIQVQESERMRSDSILEPVHPVQVREATAPLTHILLTGPTGFFGPFLLNSLLRHTTCAYYALMRATDPMHGMQRVRAALQGAQVWTPDLDQELEKRVRVVCGDIALHNLGLRSTEWRALADEVQAVFHNAALVNYVLNYDALRPHNVEGTRELLRFACAGTGKEFHFVSSTIIFGWTPKGLLFESDNNDEMSNLDFGYAQSKWVAEQLVFAAGRQGLKTQIYRPSFISTSTGGVGSRSDIAILLLAFMINHGIAANVLNQISFLPADIAADSISLIFKNRQIGSGTYHVTVDGYYNMVDITRVITRDYGYQFRYYDLPEFITEMKRRCSKDDPLYPLLYFFTEAHPKLTVMKNKRYNNDRYREMRRLACVRGDPHVEDTVSYLMKYMLREGIINAKLAAPTRV